MRSWIVLFGLAFVFPVIYSTDSEPITDTEPIIAPEPVIAIAPAPATDFVKKTCPKNEVWTDCGAHGCQNTCANPELSTVCDPLPGCFPGCICKKGYLRDESTGKCVSPKRCPSKKCTGENEVFSACDAHGCQNTCEEPYRIASCTYAAGCYPGCICADGFLRNANGVCVPRGPCLSNTCTGVNEEFQECGTACPLTCDNKDESIICTLQCVEGCFCKNGFVRDANGACIAPENCPSNKTCNKPNEVYSECGNNSCQRNCDTYDRTDIACRPSCNPGCICREGYIRNQNGVCVTPDQCENRQCKGENEAYTSCVCPCCETCATLGQDITCNFLVCNPGCDCKPGFFRNSKGVCVPPEKCDCKENETLDLCFNSCPPRTCDAIGKQFKCPAPDPDKCKPACSCAFNYRRDSNGICIPIRDCPPLECTGKNEVYDACPDQCLDERCESLYDRPRPCPKIRRECAPQCVCQPGYLRDKNGVCIAKEKCEKPCKKNESYNPCPYSCPPEDTCESYLSGLIIDCAPPPEDRECIPRCECNPGFVRKTAGGECIKAETCCEDPNAEVVSCPNPCPGGTCEQPEFSPCKAACRIRGCQCKKGYVKDANGKCILLSKCPKKDKCKPNEVYKTCGTDVRPTCDNPNPKCSKKCVAGCFCKDGHILNKAGVCIPKKDCPKPKTCKGQNEVYQECGTACPRTCQNKDDDIICTEQCVPGCFCIPNFVRKNGVCVDPKDCGCGINETYHSKAPTIQETCATIGKKPKCKTGPGCICLSGFVRKSDKGKCIKIKDCKK